MREKASLGGGALLILLLIVGIVLGGQFQEIIFHSQITPQPQMTFHPQIPFSFEEETIEVSSKEVTEYLNSKPLKEKRGKPYLTLLSDKTIHLPKLSAFQRFLRKDNLNEYQSPESLKTKERFGYDESAFILKGRAAENGFALGVIWILFSERKQKKFV